MSAVAEVRRSELAIMDETGDVKILFDPNNDDEIASARAAFDKAKAKGYWAYRVQADGEKGEVISRFDETAGKIIMAPRRVGG